MPNKITIAALLLFSILSSSPSYAVKSIIDCEKEYVDKSGSEALSRCLDGVISQIDRDLQTWVNLHTFNLEEKALSTGRYSALKMFKRSQSNFITYRENDCRWQYLAVSPERGADLAYKKCYILLSESRISSLSNITTAKNNL